MSYVIGVDGGTESLRAFVFDLDGRPLASVATPYKTEFPQPSWAEQNPEDWWAAMGQSVRGAVARSGVSPADVIAISVDTTCCSVVALDAAGKPLRPCMIWMDVRSAAEADEVAATRDEALRVNGGGAGPVSAEWMIPKSLWMKRHQPEVFARAAKVGEYQDYMNLRLTGRWVGSLGNAAIRWHYQTQHGGVPRSLLAALGLAELEAKWPSPILAPGTPLGPLTKEAAEHLGLGRGTLVVQGGSDAFIGVIGLGVTRPGEMALITGSSHLHIGIADRVVHKPGVWGTYMDGVYPGKPVIEGGQTSTGSVVAWFKRHFAEHTGWDALNEGAAALPPGAEGLLVLDHFQGNRTPYTDALSRGAITGLTLKHTPAHVFRAIIEGICLGTRLITDSFGEAFSPKRIVLAGGASNSPLWLQIHADTIGAPIELTEVPDAPALGCAILAAHGAGRYDTIEEGCAAMVRSKSVIEPDPARTRFYEAEMLPRYAKLYAALKSVRG
ncbi:FGGY-family carbohydrate kinase [Aestuariivirga sp.]|uniref:FGGY-family carbohydrate kinase n=1 Tax=Aestuariivirga sp. TaxID=2650926 RepID=UPI00391ACB1A